jgi:hypothetical protein
MFSEGATAVDFVSGLLDQWQYAGNAEAFQLVLKMAAWVHDRVEATINMGGMLLWQQVLLPVSEWGGMNDVLFDMYWRRASAFQCASLRGVYLHTTIGCGA